MNEKIMKITEVELLSYDKLLMGCECIINVSGSIKNNKDNNRGIMAEINLIKGVD